MSVMAAIDPRLVDGMSMWVEHKVFDPRAALEHGPDIGFGPVPCPGRLWFCQDEFDESSAYVIVECDRCDYAVGVRREIVGEHLGEVIPETGREPLWWWR